jgi:DNA-nicking Smr family endonuclease
VKHDELAALRKQLLAQRAQAETARPTPPPPRLQPPSAPNDAEAFKHHVGNVAPVRARARVVSERNRPEPVPRQRMLDERAALAQSMSDELDVETLLDTDEALSFKRPQVGPDVPRRLRRGQWALQAEIDLHGLTRDGAREALARFIAEAAQRGARCVRVVHGKGIGSPGRLPVLKGKVRAWLVQNELVMAFVQAPRAQGGHGALLVLLDG